MKLTRDKAAPEIGRSPKRVSQRLATDGHAIARAKKSGAGPRFSFALNRSKLRERRRREGRYLLRSNSSPQETGQGVAILCAVGFEVEL